MPQLPKAPTHFRAMRRSCRSFFFLGFTAVVCGILGPLDWFIPFSRIRFAAAFSGIPWEKSTPSAGDSRHNNNWAVLVRRRERVVPCLLVLRPLRLGLRQ